MEFLIPLVISSTVTYSPLENELFNIALKQERRANICEVTLAGCKAQLDIPIAIPPMVEPNKGVDWLELGIGAGVGAVVAGTLVYIFTAGK